VLTSPSLLAGASRARLSDRRAGDLELWTLWVDDLEPEQLDLSVLDAQERRRSEDLARAGDRLGYAAGHVLLRELLSRRLGVAPEEVTYRREACPCCGGPNGRPVLDGPVRSPYFSISRSAGVVLIGIATAPVGVDVQVVAQRAIASDVSTLLHADELGEVRSAARSERAVVFTRLWTRKEADLKGVGTGVAHDLATEYVGTRGSATGPRGWAIIDVPIAVGYVAAAATRRQAD
jgi:4'-phosphopantetheinyl transferase